MLRTTTLLAALLLSAAACHVDSAPAQAELRARAAERNDAELRVTALDVPTEQPLASTLDSLPDNLLQRASPAQSRDPRDLVTSRAVRAALVADRGLASGTAAVQVTTRDGIVHLQGEVIDEATRIAVEKASLESLGAGYRLQDDVTLVW